MGLQAVGLGAVAVFWFVLLVSWVFWGLWFPAGCCGWVCMI